MTAQNLDRSVLDGLIGKRFVGVRYHQLLTDERVADWSLVPEFDSVDLAVELATANGQSVLFRWAFDDATRDYAICAETSPLVERGLSAPVDVLSVSRWQNIAGAAFESITEARWARDPGQDTSYAPALVLRFSGGRLVVLAAADYDVSRKRLVAGAEGVTVFFSASAANEAGIRWNGSAGSY